MPSVQSLEFSADEMRRMANAVTARSIEHVASLGAQPVLGDVNARAFCRELRKPVVTGAVARGRYLGRVCVLSFRTHAEQIDWLVEDVEAGLREIRG